MEAIDGIGQALVPRTSSRMFGTCKCISEKMDLSRPYFAGAAGGRHPRCRMQGTRWSLCLIDKKNSENFNTVDCKYRVPGLWEVVEW